MCSHNVVFVLCEVSDIWFCPNPALLLLNEFVFQLLQRRQKWFPAPARPPIQAGNLHKHPAKLTHPHEGRPVQEARLLPDAPLFRVEPRLPAAHRHVLDADAPRHGEDRQRGRTASIAQERETPGTVLSAGPVRRGAPVEAFQDENPVHVGVPRVPQEGGIREPAFAPGRRVQLDRGRRLQLRIGHRHLRRVRPGKFPHCFYSQTIYCKIQNGVGDCIQVD